MRKEDQDQGAEKDDGLETAEEDLEVEREGAQGARVGEDQFPEEESNADGPGVACDEDLKVEKTGGREVGIDESKEQKRSQDK